VKVFRGLLRDSGIVPGYDRQQVTAGRQRKVSRNVIVGGRHLGHIVDVNAHRGDRAARRRGR